MGTLGYEVQISHKKCPTLNIFSVSFGRCNLEVSPQFLEYVGIIEHCCAFGFLGKYQPLPYREVQANRESGLDCQYRPIGEERVRERQKGLIEYFERRCGGSCRPMPKWGMRLVI